MTRWNRSLPAHGRDGFHAVRDQTLRSLRDGTGGMAIAKASELPRHLFGALHAPRFDQGAGGTAPSRAWEGG